MPDLVDLDVFVHERRDRSVLVSRSGDRREACWIALVHIDLAMRGSVQALATMPRWLAVQEGLIKPPAVNQPNLFGSP